MGHKVLTSIENAFGDRCVDIFVRTDGTYGFEECRRDPEDMAEWRSLHRYSRQVFDSQESALIEARKYVRWLTVAGA